MKLVIELEIGTPAVKTYRNAKKIIGDQVGLVGARHGVSLQIDIPEYGDTGLLTDAKNRTVGSWRVDVSGEERLPPRKPNEFGRQDHPKSTNTLQ
jgi:hypothetical protein